MFEKARKSLEKIANVRKLLKMLEIKEFEKWAARSINPKLAAFCTKIAAGVRPASQIH